MFFSSTLLRNKKVTGINLLFTFTVVDWVLEILIQEKGVKRKNIPFAIVHCRCPSLTWRSSISKIT